MSIPARLEEIRDRMERAKTRSGRTKEDITLVAVTKTRSVEEIAEAVRCGVTDVGENRVQEADSKFGTLDTGLRWHLVGHLQKNKARKAVELFDWIHSVDTLAIGRRLDRLAFEASKEQRVLVQVDLAGEETKFGLPERELFPVLETFRECKNLAVEGLMVLPPFLDKAEDVRPYFRRLRELSDESTQRGLLDGRELSMGMSHDFEIAIEEGATMIRIGTSIFGPRPAPSERVQVN